MKMQIQEFAKFTGVSVRTLHYYDEIGLLKPASVERSTGYRYYDEDSLLRMQEILFYRELDFSLKSIGEILSSPTITTPAPSRSCGVWVRCMWPMSGSRRTSTVPAAKALRNLSPKPSKFTASKADPHRKRWGFLMRKLSNACKTPQRHV